MKISIYEGSVGTYLQTLDAVAGFLGKGLAYCRENGLAAQKIVDASLFPDMRPFGFQIHRIILHSIGAIDAIRSGMLPLPPRAPSDDYQSLQARIDDARDALRQIAPEEIDSREGSDLVFRTPDAERVFTAEGFLLSFSLPNFHFHATTAYNILRSRGVPLGKLDYMGALRLKSIEAP